MKKLLASSILISVDIVTLTITGIILLPFFILVIIEEIYSWAKQRAG